ncbi:MAG: hypothetical protein AB1765_11020 [Candidatus Hydrogenedentota bacterium]
MKDNYKKKKKFIKPVLIKYGSIDKVTLVSPTETLNVSCAGGGGCTTQTVGTAIPEFCSYC